MALVSERRVSARWFSIQWSAFGHSFRCAGCLVANSMTASKRDALLLYMTASTVRLSEREGMSDIRAEDRVWLTLQRAEVSRAAHGSPALE